MIDMGSRCVDDLEKCDYKTGVVLNDSQSLGNLNPK